MFAIHTKYLKIIPKASSDKKYNLYTQLDTELNNLKNYYWYDFDTKKSDPLSAKIDKVKKEITDSIRKFDSNDKKISAQNLIDEGELFNAKQYLKAYFNEQEKTSLWNNKLEIAERPLVLDYQGFDDGYEINLTHSVVGNSDIYPSNTVEYIKPESNNDINDGNKVTEAKNNKPATNTGTPEPTTNTDTPVISITPPDTSFDIWKGLYSVNHYTENESGDTFLLYSSYVGGLRTIFRPDAGVTLQLSHRTIRERSVNLTNSDSDYFGDYSHIAWGTWSDSTPKLLSSDSSIVFKAYNSHWVLVDEESFQTPLLQQGEASYTGDVLGTIATFGQENSFRDANGHITLDVNFDNHDITGNMIVNHTGTGVQFADVSFESSLSNTGWFESTLIGQNVLLNGASKDSSISGVFGDAEATEVGGVWKIHKGTEAPSYIDGRQTFPDGLV